MGQQFAEQFERFASDIATHKVSVLRDDGLYRHLRCSRGSYAYQFDIVTWPGYLCYTGDMGSFVFSRLPDMFEFFRGRREAMIDRGYLAEKCVASDKPDGIEQYSEEAFRSAVHERVDSFIEEEGLSDYEASELRIEVADVVLSSGDNRHDAIAAAMDFRWSHNGGREREVFSDFWEHRLREYTTRFWWCCYAIPWAIEQYDLLKHEAATATALA